MIKIDLVLYFIRVFVDLVLRLQGLSCGGSSPDQTFLIWFKYARLNFAKLFSILFIRRICLIYFCLFSGLFFCLTQMARKLSCTFLCHSRLLVFADQMIALKLYCVGIVFMHSYRSNTHISRIPLFNQLLYRDRLLPSLNSVDDCLRRLNHFKAHLNRDDSIKTCY